MEKYLKDNKVAVLYSPGFGAGWSTWNPNHGTEIVFNPWIVDILLQETLPRKEINSRIQAYCALKYPDLYLGGLDDLDIRWLPVGTRFRITEYDGNENIEILENTNWLEA